jgi:hypothetical protein
LGEKNETLTREAEEEVRRKKEADEEEERKKLEGTKVRQREGIIEIEIGKRKIIEKEKRKKGLELMCKK